MDNSGQLCLTVLDVLLAMNCCLVDFPLIPLTPPKQHATTFISEVFRVLQRIPVPKSHFELNRCKPLMRESSSDGHPNLFRLCEYCVNGTTNQPGNNAI